MTHSDKSVKLTLYVVRILAAVFFIMLFAFPFVFKPLFADAASDIQYRAFVITFYACCPCAAVTLYCLNKLLGNVKNNLVFTAENTKLLKSLSVTCLIAAVLSVPLCFFLPLMVVFPIEAMFMSLILHVVKNVIEKGSEIKNENDLTI